MIENCNGSIKLEPFYFAISQTSAYCAYVFWKSLHMNTDHDKEFLFQVGLIIHGVSSLCPRFHA